MSFEILGHGLAVVLVGKFNPAIISPAWLASTSLVSEADAEAAELQLIHPQVSEFGVGNFKIFVDADRFQISTTQEPFVELADWIGVIFGKKLSHTPITSVGINYNGHFALANGQQRHKLGRALAPLTPWGPWGEELEAAEKGDDRSGMRSLTMIEVVRSDRPKGYIQTKIEPSVRSDILSTGSGVFMHVNDHYEVDNADKALNGSECVDWVISNLENSVARSKRIMRGVYEYAETLQ